MWSNLCHATPKSSLLAGAFCVFAWLAAESEGRMWRERRAGGIKAVSSCCRSAVSIASSPLSLKTPVTKKHLLLWGLVTGQKTRITLSARVDAQI